MKKLTLFFIFLIFVFNIVFGQDNVSTPMYLMRSGDTLKPIGPWYFRMSDVRGTVSPPTKPMIVDSLNSASPWFVRITRTWQFDSAITVNSINTFTLKSMSATDSAWWWRKSDSASTPGVTTIDRFLDSLIDVQSRIAGLKPATAVYSDSTAKADWAKVANKPYTFKSMSASDSLFWWRKSDSASAPGVPTINRMLDSLADLQSRISGLKPATAVYADSTAKADWAKVANKPYTFKSMSASDSTWWIRKADLDTTRIHYLDKSGQTTGSSYTLNGGIPWTVISRTADTTKGNGNAFVNIGTLMFSMASSGFYEVEWRLFIVRATAANGFTVAHNFSQAPSNVSIVATAQNDVAQGTDMLLTNFLDTYLDSIAVNGTTVTTGEMVWGRGWILNAGSSTDFKLRIHGELATNVTIKRGSYVMYRRLY